MSEQPADNAKEDGGDKIEEKGEQSVEARIDGIMEGETIIEGTVMQSGKEKHLKLTSRGLVLTSLPAKLKKGKDKGLSLSWRDVLRAVRDPKAPEGHQHSTFILHYIQHQSKHLLRSHSIKIEDKDGHAERWINVICEQCHKVPGRPKNLFVVVNPFGGAGKGQQIYQKTVAPLFELAEVHTTVQITERSKHAVELGETQDFSSYDGIVVVGGDGLYQEVLQGLTVQWQKSAGVDYHNADAGLLKLCNGLQKGTF